MEENNYYPFGLKHKGYNNVITSTNIAQKYKTFQGQEFTDDLGLNIHEWKYRISDPAIGRFWQIDPLAEDYVHNGTYNFSENRVMDAVELEGLEALRLIDLGQLYRQDLELEGVEAANKNLRGNQKAASDGAVTGIGIVATSFIPGPEDIAIAGFVATKVGGTVARVAGKVADEVGGFVKKLFSKSYNTKKGTNVALKGVTKMLPKGSKSVFTPKDANGVTLKTTKTKAGNTKIDAEARGRAHTQLRVDKTGNYPQRTTFDSKGRKRADTHYTTHGEKNKSNPHKHTYYKDGRRNKNGN